MRKSGKQTAPAIHRNAAATQAKRKRAVARAKETGTALIRPLTASGLKDVLWETLVDLRHENILPNRADAIAAQSREILRTIKTQLQIAGAAKRGISQEIVDFAER